MKEIFKNLKLVLKYSKKQRSKMIICIIFEIIGVVISVIIPILSAKIIIYLTDNNFYQLVFIALIIFAIEGSKDCANYIRWKYSQIIYRESFNAIQIDLGKQILKLENKVIDNNSSGVFIQRLTDDTTRLAQIFNSLTYILSNIVSDIGILIALFIINKIVFLFVLTSVIVLYLIEKQRTKVYLKKDDIYRKEKERVSGFVGELVRGSRDIKMLNAETSFINCLKEKIKKLNSLGYDKSTTDNKYHFFRGIIQNLYNLLIILLISLLLIKGKLVVATALVAYNYSDKLSYFVEYIGMLLDEIRDFKLSSARVFSIINGNEFSKETFGKKHLNNVKGDFEFKNVEFSYENKKVLKGVNFKIKANETVAFVGKSGAGKTTIFSLLCKMYDVDNGEITIDGNNINDLDKDSIRGNITIISQNPYIFNLSIKDNLKLVKNDLTDDEMIDACKQACLHKFIISLPDKYETIIGEGGVNLSGGQKQRLAIARAFIQKTEIILFDEATSALDNETQTQIQQSIENMKNKYTILIIAHRLSTIINSDKILFLNKGKIEIEGSHKELLKKSSAYRILYESEINK